MLEHSFKWLSPLFIIIGLRSPAKGLLIWILLSPFSNLPIFDAPGLFPSVSFDRLAVVTILVGFLFGNDNKQLFSMKFNKLEKWMVVFMITLTVELLIHFRPKDAMQRFLENFDRFFIPFLTYYFIKFLLVKDGGFNERLFRKIVNVVIITGICIASIGIYEGITLKDLLPAPETEFVIRHGGGLRLTTGFARVNGPYHTPETYGIVLSMIFLMILYRADMWHDEREPITKRAFLMFAAIAVLVGIYFNMFRSIWLGLAIGSAVRFPLLPKKRLKMIFIGFLLILGLACMWSEITSENIYKNRISNTGTFFNRVGAWLYCFRAFSENPIIGIGHDKLEKYIEHAFERGDITYVGGERPAYSAHNTFLEMIAENGIVGIIPFLIILGLVFQNIIKLYSCAKTYKDVLFCACIFGIFIVYFIPMFFDNTGSYPKINNFFYLFLGMIAAKNISLQSVKFYAKRQLNLTLARLLPKTKE